MQLDQIVVQIGQTPITAGELAVAGGGAALVLLLITAILAWKSRSGSSREAIEAMRRTAELEYRLAELSGTLRGFAEQAQGNHLHLARTLDERLDQVSHRLGVSLQDQADRTGQSLSQLNERLAVIDTAQKRIADLSGEMLTLRDILSNKQARGAYGQGRMEAIVRDGLHSSAYTFQATLSNNTRPDCLIRLPDSELTLVIDAKFPLEAFNALKMARGDSDVKAAEAQLRGDVLKHVKDISSKYLIRGETHESAIMFVPSEAVYAELYERFEDVIQKAHRARVIIASPNILMLLIQTMQAIFKDARMREQAGLIQVEVSRMLEDVSRLKERVADLQRHFGMASADLEKLGVSADKVMKRGLRIESLDLTEQPAVAEAPKPRLVERR
ncbi:MAG: DNA recombination protein RmuC [Alphaproteobacteria bacterium]|nr:DNA recombination protein RmuC [Alphaproteobacteria bacterium]